MEVFTRQWHFEDQKLHSVNKALKVHSCNVLWWNGLCNLFQPHRKSKGHAENWTKQKFSKEEDSTSCWLKYGITQEVGYLLVWQLFPSNPSRHLHVYPLIPSSHVPPFWHGPELHSFTSKIQTLLLRFWLESSVGELGLWVCWSVGYFSINKQYTGGGFAPITVWDTMLLLFMCRSYIV